MANDDQGPQSIDLVLAHELEVIRVRRASRRRATVGDAHTGEHLAPPHSASNNAWNEGLLGIAFSGGGIRSATFNLGILQGLAEMRILRQVDYLSTVSGGGYIGAWFSAALTRAAGGSAAGDEINHIEQRLARSKSNPAQHPEITHLRNFSNYLTPKLGMFSADTWAALTTYLRNFFLNALMIIGALAAAILGVRCVHYLLASDGGIAIKIGLFIVTTVFATVILGRNMAGFQAPGERLRENWSAHFDDQTRLLKTIVVPGVIASAVASVVLPGLNPSDFAPSWMVGGNYLVAGVFVALGMGLVWIAALLFTARSEMRGIGMTWVWTAFLAGLIGGAVLWGLSEHVLRPLSSELRAAFGAPLLLSWATAQGFLHIGLLGRRIPDEQREWLSRLSGWLLIAGIVWFFVFAITFLGPLVIQSIGPTLQLALTSGWVLTAIAAALAGRGSGAASAEPSRLVRLLVSVAPFIFIFGLIAIIAHGLNEGLLKAAAEIIKDDEAIAVVQSKSQLLSAYINRDTEEVEVFARDIGIDASTNVRLVANLETGMSAVDFAAVWSAYLVHYRAGQHWPLLALFIALAALGFGTLSARVNINDFSLSRFYANRLVRCYVGASVSARDRATNTNPFSEFSQTDDLPFAAAKHNGPFHIVNMAINLVAGDKLAWQERKAGPFFVSPEHYGFSLADGENDGGHYRATGSDDAPASRWTLGEAIATSGAAASPSMGYHSSPPFAFLLTILNIRLGRWIGNPGHAETWRAASPAFSLRYLLLELFGFTNANSRFAYLSDGGHFENLGVYELVRRRCRYVIACDAGADPELRFEDLGNLIRKCRSDLGVDIDIDVAEIRGKHRDNFSRRHCAVGTIYYPDRSRGTFVYIKASLSGDEPEDVLNYASGQAAFPHETTADQFFSESQFESYRSLGAHVASAVFKSSAEGFEEKPFNLEAFFLKLRQYWHAPARASKGTAVNYSRRLDLVYERLRKTPELAYLDRQFYPELRVLETGDPPTTAQALRLPEDSAQFREGFYICNALLQLMEDVYLDLDLEDDWDHPNNAGWMNLFKHWSWTPIFRATWSICAATFSNRFQNFCEQRLQMQLGRVAAQPLRMRIDVEGKLKFAGALVTLNFLERDQIESIVVDEDGALRSEWSVLQLDLHVESGVPGLSLLQYNFGYCIMRGDELIGFRIQDHLRNMGLGRTSLARLIERQPQLRVPVYDELPANVRALLSAAKGHAILEAFARDVHSVRQEADG